MRRALLSFILLIVPAYAQQKPDAAQQGLRGHVRSMRIEFLQGDSTEPRLESDQAFDSNGWLTELKQFGSDGDLQVHNIFKRNGARMIEAQSTRYFPPDMAERIVTVFEEHGFPIQMTRYAPDGSVRERMVTEYQEAQIVERHYDGNDKLITTRTISMLHDPESPNRHIEQKVNDNPELSTDIRKSDGRTDIREQKFGEHGRVEERSIRQLDSSGARGATLKANGSSTTFIVAAECQDISFRGNPNGGFHQRCDDQGRPVEETIEGPDGKTQEIIHFSYLTDDQGNWTRRTAESLRNGKIRGKSAIIREIKYY